MRQRFGSLMELHLGPIFEVFELFFGSFSAAEEMATRLFATMWRDFALLDPQRRTLTLYRRAWELLHQSADSLLPPPPATLLPVVGEWSPIRPNDAADARSLLLEARRLVPDLDWPGLFLCARTPLTLEGYAAVLGVPADQARQRFTLAELGATSALQFVALCWFDDSDSSPDIIDPVLHAAGDLPGAGLRLCPNLPAPSPRFPSLVADHVLSCQRCGKVLADMVPLPRLLAGAASSELRPTDTLRIFSHVLETPEASRLASEWWHLE